MRIWLQSATAIGKDPQWQHYENAVKNRAQEVARPGTTVDFHGVGVMAPGLDRSSYIEFANTPQIINNALKAEKEGYDAFAFTCMLDPGFFELREVIDMPIAFAFESVCHVASLLAPKFALMAENDIILRRLTGYAKHHHGLGERLVPGGCFRATMGQIANSFHDPEPLLKELQPIASKAGEQGADMLITTCAILNMVLVANGIKEIEGIPFLDSVGTTVKMAEFLVDLKNMGIDRVNRGLYTRLTKEQLLAVRKLYKLD